MTVSGTGRALLLLGLGMAFGATTLYAPAASAEIPPNCENARGASLVRRRVKSATSRSDRTGRGPGTDSSEFPVTIRTRPAAAPTPTLAPTAPITPAAGSKTRSTVTTPTRYVRRPFFPTSQGTCRIRHRHRRRCRHRSGASSCRAVPCTVACHGTRAVDQSPLSVYRTSSATASKPMR